MAFKDRLKALRLQRNISQVELAKALNVSAGAIGGYENGSRTPKSEILTRMADYFRVSPEDLIYGKRLNVRQLHDYRVEIEPLIRAISDPDALALGIDKTDVLSAIKEGRLREDRAVTLASAVGICIDHLFDEDYYKNAPENEALSPQDIELQLAFDARPDLRLLFSTAKDASPEDIQTAIKIISALKDKNS